MANEQKSRNWTSFRSAAAGGLLLAAVGLIEQPSLAQAPRTPACIQYWGESRYRDYGYDHIVHIGNACQARATCLVSSDLTPSPVHVDVPIAEQVDVLLARSPTPRDFSPRVECGLVL